MASVTSLAINDREPSTMFFEKQTAEKTPQIQIDFDTHIDPLIWSMTSGNGGLMQIIDGGIARVGTEGNADGSARMETWQHAFYHAGQGLLIQFSARWVGTPTEGNSTFIGYGDLNNGLFIGYNNTDFGVLRINRGTSTWYTSLVGDDVSWLDPSKSNVYAIQAQMHYMGRIEWLVFRPRAPRPYILHVLPWSNTNIGTTLQTATLPLALASVNTGGSTANMAVETASMAVFSQGRTNKGTRYKATTANNTMSVEAGKIMMKLRVRSTLMGATSHAVGLIAGIHSATRSDREGWVTIYKNAVLETAELNYTPVHECSIFEVAKPENASIVSADLSGTVSGATASAGATINTFTVVGVDGSNNRLVGMTVVLNNTGRTVLTSAGTPNATVTVAGMPGVAGDYDGGDATFYNGHAVFAQALGKDASARDIFTDESMISLSPGESITVTAQTPDATQANIVVSVNWIERL